MIKYDKKGVQNLIIVLAKYAEADLEGVCGACAPPPPPPP